MSAHHNAIVNPRVAHPIPYDTTGVSGTHQWSEPGGEVEPLPSSEWLTKAQEALRRSKAVQALLWHERGISAATAERFGIGFARDLRHPSGRVIQAAWIVPIHSSSGAWVNVVHRPVGRVARPWRLRGRTLANGGLPLYPSLPRSGPLLLLAGEFDVLPARQAGIRGAITGLLGCTWYAAWNSEIIGRRIAVLYDRSEERQAARTVEALRRGGAAQAWAVSWAGYRDDLPDGYDLQQFLQDGHTAEDVYELIRQVRP